MPQRVELREKQGGAIGGIPFALAYSRDRRAVMFVATYDGDGLMETREDCQAAASRFLDRLDALDKKRKDEPA